ncbi:MAG: hypothetical protein ACREBW_10535 [Candidatus Micrarchaeaceae archaeon]
MDTFVSIVLQWIIVVFIGVNGIIILFKIWSDKINLNMLLKLRQQPERPGRTVLCVG